MDVVALKRPVSDTLVAVIHLKLAEARNETIKSAYIESKKLSLTVSYTWVNALTSFLAFLDRIETTSDSCGLKTSVRAT